jgi:hypothetical protein
VNGAFSPVTSSTPPPVWLLVRVRAQGESPWKLIWAGNFNGPAYSSVNTSYWKYDSGWRIFDTGEVETIGDIHAKHYGSQWA